MKTIYTLLSLIIILTLAGCGDAEMSNVDSSPTTTEVSDLSEKESVPLLGEEYFLGDDSGTDQKMIVIDTEENYIESMKVAANRDIEGSKKLLFNGNISQVDNGTRVMAIEYVKSDAAIGYKGIKIKILEGEKYNSTGYVPMSFLKSINEDTLEN